MSQLEFESEDPEKVDADERALGETESAVGTGEWASHLTSRLRVLLYTEPLLKMHQSDNSREDTRHYDALALALKTFDLIAHNMGLGREMDSTQIAVRLSPLLTQMDLAAGLLPDPKRHTEMTDYILGKLRNDDEARRPYTIHYTAFEAGKACRRILHAKLIEEQFDPGGSERIVLHLSWPALNLFLNALDLEIEDAQAATQALVRSQLRRGQVHKALESAQQARLLSLSYRQKILTVLQQTQRNLAQMDWRTKVPQLLEEARVHLEECRDFEYGIEKMAQDSLEKLSTDSKEAQAIREILNLIAECHARHTHLHQSLMQVRPLFLSEQERQAFVPRRSLAGFSLSEDVLYPFLTLPFAEAERMVMEVAPLLLGADTPGVLSLKDLMLRHLRPRRRDEEGGIVEELDLTLVEEETPRYTETIRNRAEVFLRDGVTKRMALSQLLRLAEEAGEETAVLECIALEALRQFAPDSISDPEEKRGGWRSDHMGRLLDVAGFEGDDLQLSGDMQISKQNLRNG